MAEEHMATLQPWTFATQHLPERTLLRTHGLPSGIKCLCCDGDQGQESQPLTALTLNPRWHFFPVPCQEKQQDSFDTRGPCCPQHRVAALQSLPGCPWQQSCDSPWSFLCQGRKYLPTHRRHKAIYALFVLSCDFFFLQIVLPRRRKKEANIFSHLKMCY